ncbi:lamin tail domain-containing protein [Wenyingzhuangia sp. 2_MG-2023]|uniref:lamin tail domain-containing protein n=1 Tax=Wenyingzhuangia sp. 2_MG-2023 TaxID=3062639 RepID=UPI0026E1D850|nr:lamin tail domain-containing protein [Wenyingzhuangia sp. 2_MG-2023]MDO6737235.1 lamin tail domain-containing protein [Wenyingzhuangia sp. 2_MG-2023]
MKKITLFITLLVTTLSFGQIFITEIADPNDNITARYFELYNAGASDVDLSTGYALERYTNDNAATTSNVPLTGIIKAGGFYLVAANATEFENAYGFAPDQAIGTGGPADSNGDDQIQLIDSSSNVIDIFGVPGEDGTGTCHEFEDGRAERIASVTSGNNGTWNEANWNVRADSNVSGCTSHSNAPVNTTDGIYDPGTWIGSPDADTTTSVSFFTSSTSVSENIGTIDVCISITNPNDTNATTVDLNLNVTSTAVNGTDYSTVTFPQSITFPAGSSTNQCFTFTITDDEIQEAEETIVLNLENVSGGTSAKLGNIAEHTINITASDLPPSLIFITEIADPNNNDTARYLELYNAGTADVDLSTGYALERYTNGNAATTSNVPLTGTIEAGGFYIVAANATSFETAYGFAPHQDISTGGPADSNGDDQIQLVDASSNVLDIFGIPGEDGTGTCHEFENGRAERISSVSFGNSGIWNEANWNIKADNDISGCTSHSNAPVDTTDGIFDPGAWIGATLSIKDNKIPGLVLTASNGTVTTNTGEITTIYNVVGQKVENGKLAVGLYIVIVKSNNTLVTEKVLVN